MTTGAGAGAGKTPWETLWANWNSGAADAGGTAATLGRLARGYTEFAESVLRLTAKTDGGGVAQALADVMERMAHGLHTTESGDDGAGLRAFLTAVPAQIASAQAALGEQGLQRKFIERLLEWAKEFVDLPAIGPQRDWQSALQAVQRGLIDEQHAATRLGQHYQQANAQALLRFAAFLRDDSGAPIATLAALYDAWVDIAEAAYAEVVMSAQFAQDFAASVNAGSTTRRHANALRERIAAALDLPQRAEINALLARQREQQSVVEELRAEIAALHARAVVSTVVQAPVAVSPAATAAVEPVEARRAVREPRPVVKAPATPAPRKAGRQVVNRDRARSQPRGFDIGDILSGAD